MTTWMMSLVAAVSLVLGAQPAEQATQAQPSEANETGDAYVYVEMKTSEGDIYLQLNNEKAPISVENFVKYAKDEAYDGTIFHRVMDNFMIQGGGFEPDMSKRETRDPIKNEWNNGLKNEKYTIAMARTSDPDSATNQFFINVNDNAFLDQASPRTGNAGYAVFGKVVKGRDVVDKIKGVKTTTKGMYQNVPVEPVLIEKVSVLDAARVEELGLASEGEG